MFLCSSWRTSCLIRCWILRVLDFKEILISTDLVSQISVHFYPKIWGRILLIYHRHQNWILYPGSIDMGSQLLRTTWGALSASSHAFVLGRYSCRRVCAFQFSRAASCCGALYFDASRLQCMSYFVSFRMLMVSNRRIFFFYASQNIEAIVGPTIPPNWYKRTLVHWLLSVKTARLEPTFKLWV